VKKGDLPTKVCVLCNRPFNWCAVRLAGSPLGARAACGETVVTNDERRGATSPQAQEVGEVLGGGALLLRRLQARRQGAPPRGRGAGGRRRRRWRVRCTGASHGMLLRVVLPAP
jgi:hypothetical protein